MDYHLQELEKKSIYILRETKAKYKNIAILWTMGMDSLVCLYLCKRAFFGKIPFQVIHTDNGHDFPENYQFRDKIVKEWQINLSVVKIVDGSNKEYTLKETVEKNKLEAIIIPTINDSHQSQTQENYVKIHPLSNWTELNVWQYIKENGISVNPLSFAKNGKRYKNIGYAGAALLVESNAKTIDEIIEELKTEQVSKKNGQVKDEEQEAVFERLRKLGYM